MTSRSSGRSALKLEKFTADSPLNRTIHQPESGYRFTIDPFILASHVPTEHHQHIVDIGTGCGIIPLLIAWRCPTVTITGIEIQKELADYALKNAAAHNFEKSIEIINSDIITLLSDKCIKKADVIVSNPPYKKKGTGRINPDRQKAIARHEITLDMNQVFNAVDHILCRSGKFYLIYPADRLGEILSAACQHQMHLHFLRFVHPSPNEDAIRVVACFGKKSISPSQILHPLFLYDSKKRKTEAYLSMFTFD